MWNGASMGSLITPACSLCEQEIKPLSFCDLEITKVGADIIRPKEERFFVKKLKKLEEVSTATPPPPPAVRCTK